jgi:hypothetical protein
MTDIKTNGHKTPMLDTKKVKKNNTTTKMTSLSYTLYITKRKQ